MLPREALQRYRKAVPKCCLPARALELLAAEACSGARGLLEGTACLRGEKEGKAKGEALSSHADSLNCVIKDIYRLYVCTVLHLPIGFASRLLFYPPLQLCCPQLEWAPHSGRGGDSTSISFMLP